MQKDLHHAGTYVICRLAGMKSEYAQIVAYAAQQVDDATHGHVLRFTNGEVFRQTMTAHKAISTINFNVSDSLGVWVPFHFLPAGKCDHNPNGLVTGADSSSLNLLKESLINNGNTPLALYRLGIGLHCYADTFSHQDFKGFFDRYNDITIDSIREGLACFTSFKRKKEILRFYMSKFLSKILPSVGHGQALTCPDIPYLSWAYNRKNEDKISVDNLNQRFIIALESMYNFTVQYLQAHPQYCSVSEVKDFGAYRDKLVSLLSMVGTSDYRHQYWLDCIHKNYFEFPDFDQIDLQLAYNPREWFNAAVVVVRKVGWWPNFLLKTIKFSLKRFVKKDDFANSHWVNYMRAAAEHKYNVVHRILPQCGVDVG